MAGGTKGTHPVAKTHDFLVAPTAASETNAIRAGIIPVGCWRIDDVRFEFDSSIVLPDSSDEFAALDSIRKEHPGSPLSLYGHADPVGNDVYNKKLSGRRVEAIYALLVRDVDRWERIYKNPIDGTGDRWKYRAIQIMLAGLGYEPGPPTGELNSKTIQAVKAFQNDNGLDDDGDPGTKTRAELFPKYMDAICVDASGAPYTLTKEDFLAQGADPDGKGDFQGCGEFNPLLMFSKKENDEFKKPSKKAERDAENAPNRRVMALLYRKGSKVDPARWPCPTVKEGPGGCEKRFFANAAERRQFQGTRRRFDETKDTFACRFYQRQTEHSPCESLSGPGAVLKLWNLQWTPAKGVCGEKVKLTGETNFADGTPFKIKLSAKAGNISKLQPFEVTPSGGKFQHEMEIKNVAFDQGGSFVDKVEIEATVEDASVTIEGSAATLTVEALLDAAEDTYVKDRNNEWGAAKQYVNHSEFKQKIEKFRNKVAAQFNFVKTWGGYHVDLSAHGVTGKATDGPPWNGYRWAKPDPANPMNPGQYWDGSKWVAMPAGFSGAYSSLGFMKKGSKFVPVDGSAGEWPEAFADYDPDAKTYADKRKAWVDFTHKAWTDKLLLKRKDCHSDAKVRCCLYDVEVNIAFVKVGAWKENQTISISPGGQRANAAHWFYDRPGRTAAHETGHHLDNPDEYAGGAIDTALNVAGEVAAGIDTKGDSLMGAGNSVKKRHFRAFETMENKLIKKKYGRDFKYETVDP